MAIWTIDHKELVDYFNNSRKDERGTPLIEVILRFGSALKFGNSAMSDFSGKRVVITGAGRGIGLAIAQAFAARGAKVAVISRNETSCGAAAKAINAEYPESARFYGLDVSDFDAVQECGKKVLEDFGGVDILVNNAGVTRDGLILRMKSEDWDTVLDTNLKGAFNLVKAFQRSLMKSDAPRIINISSVIGLIGNAGQANYAASKAGLIGFTKSVARELAGRKVTCNAIAPGFITTDMTDELPEAIKEDIVKRVPLSDFGQVDDIANAVLFLAGPEARYITGQVLAVDGGMTM
jgi:3-oxoacyl-[acyl-carrier protein] reductase